jgi:hypothetical protein
VSDQDFIRRIEARLRVGVCSNSRWESREKFVSCEDFKCDVKTLCVL